MVAIEALWYISRTGQSYDFEDYRKSLGDNSPPLVVAAFRTREEAEAWLKNRRNAPYQGNVLVGGEYHYAMYDRERDRHYLAPIPVLEYYLEDMISDGLPAPVARFDTREEAESWLHSQPEPPRQVFITVAGEYFLAAYHYRVNIRALYPISRAAKAVQKDRAGEMDRPKE